MRKRHIILLVCICFLTSGCSAKDKGNTESTKGQEQHISRGTEQTTEEIGNIQEGMTTSVQSEVQVDWSKVQDATTRKMEEGETEETMIGDFYQEYDENYQFTPDLEATRSALGNLCMDYAYAIPFKEGGRVWRKSTMDYVDLSIETEENIREPADGMDALGFIIWAYRQVFGKTCEGTMNPAEYFRNNPQYRVERKNLMIGDIGMLHTGAENNHYGIYVGDEDGKAVFVHCANVPSRNYPRGSTIISYLKSDTSEYYQLSEPVDFQYFVRPDVAWKEE